MYEFTRYCGRGGGGRHVNRRTKQIQSMKTKRLIIIIMSIIIIIINNNRKFMQGFRSLKTLYVLKHNITLCTQCKRNNPLYIDWDQHSRC